LNDAQVKEYYNFINDLWKLWKKYLTAGIGDDATQAVEDAKVLEAKYKDKLIGHHRLLTAVLTQLEDIWEAEHV